MAQQCDTKIVRKRSRMARCVAAQARTLPFTVLLSAGTTPGYDLPLRENLCGHANEGLSDLSSITEVSHLTPKPGQVCTHRL